MEEVANVLNWSSSIEQLSRCYDLFEKYGLDQPKQHVLKLLVEQVKAEFAKLDEVDRKKGFRPLT
jgi:hypothetical protein